MLPYSLLHYFRSPKMKDTAFIQLMIQKGVEAKEKVKAELSSLSSEQLNWNPPNSNWSIAECLEHLIVSDGLRISIIEKKAAGDFNIEYWEKVNPLKIFWGSVLITQTQEKVKKKIKAPRLFHPPSTISIDDILIRFDEHLEKIFVVLKKCIDADIDQVQVTSPISGLVTYSLRNAITIITGHERRHINQAIRVKQVAGFPT